MGCVVLTVLIRINHGVSDCVTESPCGNIIPVDKYQFSDLSLSSYVTESFESFCITGAIRFCPSQWKQSKEDSHCCGSDECQSVSEKIPPSHR